MDEDAEHRAAAAVNAAARNYSNSFFLEWWTRKENLLGKSTFGVVYRGQYNGTLVAVKKLLTLDRTTALPDTFGTSNREVQALQRLDHPNVVKLYAFAEDDVFLYLALEFCVASMDCCFLETNDRRKYNGPLPEDRQALLQIAFGLQHIHSEGFVHRDIKPGNILISPPQWDGSVLLKLTDFGYCKPMDPSGYYDLSGPDRGSRRWMAQELSAPSAAIIENAREPIRGSTKGDIFSSGCVFFFLLTRGKHPFQDPEDARGILNTELNISNGDSFMNSLPADHFATKLIQGMIAHLPDDRISLEGVIETLSAPNN